MNCRDYRSGLIEFARGRPMASGHRVHIDSCLDCAQFLESQMALSAAGAMIADGVPAPLDVENVLMAEFESFHRRKRVVRWRWASAAAGAVAAVLGFVWFTGTKPAAKPVPVENARHVVEPPAPVLKTVSAAKKTRRRRKTAVSAKSIEPDPPFLQVPYTLPLAPYERASVMRVELPVSALIAAGVPIATANTGARARADVVIGEDGRARAFRVISISQVDSSGSIN